MRKNRYSTSLLVSAMLFAGGHAVRARAETGDQQAYEAAMKCYIVAANASLDRRKAGDEAKSVAYETKAHGDFDLAVKFGRSAGHNGANIEADILETQGRELPKLVKDVTYNRQSAATCKALGLL